MSSETRKTVRAAMLSRRTMLKAAGATALVAAGGAPAIAQAKGRIVYATWGGSWEAAIRKAWFEPFTKATGIEVITAQGNTYGKIQSMVESGRTEWDVVEVNPDFQWIGMERNLLEKLDFSVIDKTKIMPGPHLVTDYSIPQVLYSRVMFYNNKFASSPPQTWADVWNVSKYPGKRAFMVRAGGGVFEAASLADGMPADKLYPIDMDRALRKLSEIRQHILWYETNAQSEQYMSDGQAVTGCVADGRALNVIANGAPVTIQFNQSLMTWSTMLIPKGARNKDAAMKFLAYTLTPEAQAAVAMAYTYGPVVPEAYKLIPPERQKILSGGPHQQGKYVLLDEHWWGQNSPKATEKLAAWRLA
jgi:putative spermidine/putrescine transport system substrate-binding protein